MSTGSPGSGDKKVPAYEAVAQEIRHQILSGELAPGARLPSEAELIEGHGVSRSTVREAMRTLASESLVRTTRGTTGGTFVAVPDVSTIASHLTNGVALMAAAQHVTLDQLMDVRLLTEVHAVGLAAVAPNEEDLAAMHAAVEEGEQQGYQSNQDFHTVVLRAAGNPMLELVCTPVFAVLERRFLAERAGADFWASSQRDHHEIMAAIESRDSMAAMTAMQRHLHRLTDAYREMEMLSL